MAKASEETAQSQRERLIEAAHVAGADEDEERFEQRLKAVAGANSSNGASGKSEERTLGKK